MRKERIYVEEHHEEHFKEELRIAEHGHRKYHPREQFIMARLGAEEEFLMLPKGLKAALLPAQALGHKALHSSGALGIDNYLRSVNDFHASFLDAHRKVNIFGNIF